MGDPCKIQTALVAYLCTPKLFDLCEYANWRFQVPSPFTYLHLTVHLSNQVRIAVAYFVSGPQRALHACMLLSQPTWANLHL